jgi:hypothetical protein
MTASYSRNESNNRTAHTVGTPAKAGKLATEMKPAKACREANYSSDTINNGKKATAGTICTLSTAAWPPGFIGKSVQ